MTRTDRAPLHVVQITFLSDALERDPQELLDAWYTLPEVADAVRTAGPRVSVIVASHRHSELTRNDVRYHFIPADARTLAGSSAFAAQMRSLQPDVIHVHGLDFTSELLALARGWNDVPIFLQDHASRVPRWWRRSRWRRAVASAAGIAFCAMPQAEPFMAAGLIRPQTRLYEITECTSRFTPGDRALARQASGLDGDPCILWVGHLDANKDPLTVLEGVSLAVRQLPGLRLWCCFGSAPLRRDVLARIERDPLLRERVTLLGRVAHDSIETHMRAADLFVLGSRREGSGVALIEALACGLPPVVTDIPAFRMLTGRGTIGTLWPAGDAAAFAQALVSVAAKLQPSLRERVRGWFEREISLSAMGAKLVAAYAELQAVPKRGQSLP